MKQTLVLLSLVGLAGSAVLAQPVVKPTVVKPAGTAQPVDAPKTEPKKTEPKKDEPKKDEPKKDEPPAKPADPYVLGFKMKDIDDKEQALSQYKGKVILIVNVASQCGLTPSQYPALTRLYDAYKDKGFTILAFPANNFREQEPGSNADIKQFCTRYDVKFPLFAKISVKGADQHELYKQLAAQPKPVGGDPSWNFTKFLVNKEGKVVARFEPNIDPTGKEVTRKVNELLGIKEADAPKIEPAKADPSKKEEPKKPEPKKEDSKKEDPKKGG